MPETRGERRTAGAWWRAGGVVVLVTAIALAAVFAASGGQRLIRAQVRGVRGSAELRLSGTRGQLIVRDLSPPPAGDVYEVWLVPPHSPPLPTQALFSPSPRGGGDLKLPESLRGITELFVTAEPAGGSLAPTQAPVIVARLS